MTAGRWQFWIDRGGTFTDIVASDPQGRLSARKLLSENPRQYQDAVLAGIALSLGLGAAETIPPGQVGSVRIGTTVATNALLQGRGARVLLVTSPGLGDLLEIGDQSRPDLFALAIRKPRRPYARVLEISARTAVDGSEIAPLDEAAVLAALRAARAEGFECCAIALIHAWKYPALERRVAALARAAGFTQVSVSHAVSPHLRLVPRALTCVIDAALSPVLRRHVDHLAASLPGASLLFMQSHGGLADGAHFSGCNAILSGPAGGIVGAARTGEAAGIGRVISFDMGGTSTDIALYAGSLDRSFETRVAGLTLRVPSLAIHTVAAGGGSILRFDGNRMRVGPQSAGADPGPLAYRAGGPLTLTDANICLGKIRPDYFPALFGPQGDQPLDAPGVDAAFDGLAGQIAGDTGTRQDRFAVAEGFIAIAVANMAHAIREISVRRGHDPAGFALHCFGGAGGQHACLVAAALGIETILIHRLAGVLSAYGMGLAEPAVIREQTIEIALDPEAVPGIEAAARRLSDAACAALADQESPGSGDDATRPPTVVCELNLRQAGSDAILRVALQDRAAMVEAFDRQHRARFGFLPDARSLIVDSITVEARRETPPLPRPDALPREAREMLHPIETVMIRTDGTHHRAGLFLRSDLRAGDRIAGPALLSEPHGSIVIEPGWTAELTAHDDLILRRDRQVGPARSDDTAMDPVRIELFNSLFMTIAEQAGAVLQNTAQSVNIRERLDFSCAIFAADGSLLANAPHVPVHLGAMGESVRSVLRNRASSNRASSLRPGDVVALNNPSNGGTHLPDITVITPVFDNDGAEIVFFVGARGHHADIGGTVPGSTPAFSRRLEEEGVVIDDFLLVAGGTGVGHAAFREAEFRTHLASGLYPARSPDTNVADIRAQIAANAFAAGELKRAMTLHGTPVLRRAMRAVMDNAEESVRRAIGRLAEGQFLYPMDDGSRIAVSVRIDRSGRSATIDFTGTSAQRADNFNAPPAVLRAVVLYVFRCLAGDDIPLNDGCLKPLSIVIPPGTFLSPAPGAAVVAGNTEVSQAACNALFGALGSVACSQGTMNNLLFGDATRQYYETICGGTGAGPDFDGASAVQSHMTNTRMTDPEVLEWRYPVRVEQFRVRRGSGGPGAHRGGDGATRTLVFLEPMQAVLVSSRRTVAPFGLQGGGDAACGSQMLERADGRRETLGGIAQMQIEAGDRLTIHTPGGGGYGAAKTGMTGGP